MKSFLIDIISEAGGRISKYFGGDIKSEFKLDGKYIRYPQVVTFVDREIQSLLVNKIRKRYPSHHIISEEMSNTMVFNGYTWVIDPLDGTMNFVRGLPNYSISIAVFRDNEIVMGAVYAPTLQSLYFAERDSCSVLNQEAISVSHTADLDKALVAMSVYKSFLINNEESVFNNIVSKIDNMRMLASSALDMCYVATGKLDARIFANSEIWDHAAAALIVQQAGGVVTDWEGVPWTSSSSKLVVSNGLVHDQILDLINQKNNDG